MERSESRVTGGSRRGWNRLVPPALRDRSRLALFAVAAVAAIAGVGRGVGALRASNQAVVPGFSVSHRLTANPPLSADAEAAGVRPRDRIRALDGTPYSEPGLLLAELRRRGTGAAIVLDMERPDGRRYRARLTTRGSWLAKPISALIFGSIYVLTALVALWLAGGRREVWLFAIACQVMGLGMLLLAAEPPPAMPLRTARVGFLFWALAGPTLLHFVAAFPRPIPFLKRHPRLPPLVLVAVGGLAALAGLRFGPWSESHQLPMVIIAVVNLGCAIAGVAILRWRLARPQPARDAARLRLLILATVVAFAYPATATVLRVTRAWVPPTAELHAISFATMGLFPLLVTYAIATYNLLDLDRAMVKAAAYSGALVAVAALYIAVIIAVPHLAPDALAGSPTALAATLLVAMAALLPVKRGLESAATRLFHRPELDAGVAEVHALIDDAARERTAEVFARLERRIERAFRVTPAEIHLRDDNRWRRPATGDAGTVAPEPPLSCPIGDAGVLALGHPGERLSVPGGEREALAAIASELAGALAGSRAGERIGRYKVVKFLAAGGMGNVYIAEREGAGGFAKTVALKRLLPEVAIEPDTVERFVTEARVVARLSHPNIVATYELDETDGGYVIAMEFVDGIDAAALLRWLNGRGEMLPLGIAANLTAQVCLALDHAHTATDRDGRPMRLIHRDVTPHNVLVSRDGAVKLADFGVAHVKGRPSERGRLIGKTAYLAPEQLRGEPLDHRVDVFAAGVLLYELAAGEHPFRHPAGRAETWAAIEGGRHLPLTMLRADAPDELARIADRALAPDPDARFATARELAEALEALYPIESRNAVELGARVRAAAGLDEPPPRGTTETIRERR